MDRSRPAGLTLHGDPPAFLTLEALTRAALPHAVTTRYCPGAASESGPVPFVAAAADLLAAAGLDPARVAFARQVHGAGVARAAAPGQVGEADVIVTTAPGQALAVVTADCLPVILWDADVGVLAVAHVGWRGTVRRAARAAVDAVGALGGRPARTMAAIGPSIGPCCYEVDDAVVEPLAAAMGGADRWATPAAPGKWMLDLWAVNEDELVTAGIDRARIHNPRLCTSCRTDLLCSYRRRTPGRLATVAAVPVGR